MKFHGLSMFKRCFCKCDLQSNRLIFSTRVHRGFLNSDLGIAPAQLPRVSRCPCAPFLDHVLKSVDIDLTVWDDGFEFTLVPIIRRDSSIKDARP